LFLKSLELYGFKTFAERTKLIFKPGVTAIVGPNGCGKSNIVDALRWVLGESNARSLRGEIMNDIIFAGSDTVKPMGMAEVEVVLANEDNLLPIEFSEISIKRRLYRSGESEYFINKKNVRLRDIQELFADTGIGKTAYSIMEQGNIDMLLSNRPEDRMIVFEEAAGITRYKTRIKESYRKLNATDENLIRLDLIINEVDKEYKSLERQAEKARKYKELKNSEIEYEKLYTYMRIKHYEGQKSKIDSDLSKYMDEKDDLLKQKVDLEKKIEQRIKAVRDEESKIVDIKNNIYRLESEINSINSRIKHLRDRVGDFEVQLSGKKGFLEQLVEKRHTINIEIEKLKKEINATTEIIKSQEEKINNYRKEIDFLDKKINSLVEERKSNNHTINEVTNRLSELRQDLKSAIDNLLKELDNVKMKLVKSEKEKNKSVENVHQYLNKIYSEIDRYKVRIGDIELLSSENHINTFIKEFMESLDKMKDYVDTLKSNFESVFTIQENITQMIFGKEGIHTQKEKIEGQVEELVKREEDLKKRGVEIQSEIENNMARKEEFIKLYNKLNPELARNKEKLAHLKNSLERNYKDLQINDDAIQDTKFDIENLKNKIENFNQDIKKLLEESKEVELKRSRLSDSTKDHNKLIDGILKEINSYESQLEKLKSKIDSITVKISDLEKRETELSIRIKSLAENFNESFNEPLEFYHPQTNISIDEIKQRRDSVKEQIRGLGHVNLLALEELSDVKKRYDYLILQKEDLLNAKKDLDLLVSKTMEVSKKQFIDNLARIKDNFDKIFKRLFNGGKTDLYLTNSNDIFNSGIEFVAIPPGKRMNKKTLLSGGEKTLTAIALLFSIFIVKPSPFCFLDEVDHDLDEENIVRFLNLLKEFTDTTQFVIITHNRRTMEFADIIYGVTAEQPGVSKVVSLDMVEKAVG